MAAIVTSFLEFGLQVGEGICTCKAFCMCRHQGFVRFLCILCNFMWFALVGLPHALPWKMQMVEDCAPCSLLMCLYCSSSSSKLGSMSTQSMPDVAGWACSNRDDCIAGSKSLDVLVSVCAGPEAACGWVELG